METVADAWAIVVDRLLDGSGGAVLEDTGVLLRAGRIERLVRPASELLSEPGLRVERFDDATLLPGLIDAHVHLGTDPEHTDFVGQHLERSDDALLRVGARNAAQALQCGITTLRSLGSRHDVEFRLKSAADSGAIVSPHLVVCGRPITSPEGHCYFMGGEVTGVEAIERLVDEQAAAGAGVVKVMANGGGCTPGTGLLRPQFEDTELSFIAECARRHSLPIAAHVATAATIRACIESGYNTLEHSWFLTAKGIERDKAALEALAQNDVFVVSTRYQFHLLRHRDDLTGGLKLEVDSTFRRLYAEIMQQYERFRRAGVAIVAGSDAGIPGVDFRSLPGELEMMVDAGYTPSEAVQAGTSQAASALRLPDRGTIRPGMRADLVVVQGRVDRDISAIRRPLAVVLDGEIVVKPCEGMSAGVAQSV